MCRRASECEHAGSELEPRYGPIAPSQTLPEVVSRASDLENPACLTYARPPLSCRVVLPACRWRRGSRGALSPRRERGSWRPISGRRDTSTQEPIGLRLQGVRCYTALFGLSRVIQTCSLCNTESSMGPFEQAYGCFLDRRKYG